jgi:hypothetical protein
MRLSQILMITADSLYFDFSLAINEGEKSHEVKVNKLYKLENIFIETQLFLFF